MRNEVDMRRDAEAYLPELKYGPPDKDVATRLARDVLDLLREREQHEESYLAQQHLGEEAVSALTRANNRVQQLSDAAAKLAEACRAMPQIVRAYKPYSTEREQLEAIAVELDMQGEAAIAAYDAIGGTDER